MMALSGFKNNAKNDSLVVSSILNYLKSKSKSNKIQILKGNTYFKKVHITVKMIIEEHEIEGSGCSDNKNDAAMKAVMELFERYIFLTQKVDSYRKLNGKEATCSLEHIFREGTEGFSTVVTSTSNGVAAHISLSNSLKGALNEAIERHVLLKALALNIKPKLIDSDVVQDFTEEQISVKTYLWKGPLGKNIISIKGSFKNANCYGFGCADNLNDAISKAKCEIAPRIEILRKNNIYTHLKLHDNEHFDYHLQRLNPWTNDFFNNGLIVNAPEIDCVLSLDDFWFGAYSMPKDFESGNVYVVRVVSPKIQPLFKGQWDIKKINVCAFESMPHLGLPRELHIVG